MSITIKMMSDQNLPDSDNNKDFNLIVVGDGYSMSFKGNEGNPVLGLTGLSGSTTHRKIHGNVYVMNDQGKTIATYLYKNICAEVNANVQMGNAMKKMDLDTLAMVFSAANDQGGEFSSKLGRWMGDLINSDAYIRDAVNYASSQKLELPKNKEEAISPGNNGKFAEGGTNRELAEVQNKAAATNTLAKYLGQLSPTDLATDVSEWSEENVSKFIFGLFMKKPKSEKAAIVRNVQKWLESDDKVPPVIPDDALIGHHLGRLEFGNLTAALCSANEESKKTHLVDQYGGTQFHKALGEYMANMAMKGDIGVIAALKYAASHISGLPSTEKEGMRRGRGGQYPLFGTKPNVAEKQIAALIAHHAHLRHELSNEIREVGYATKPVMEWTIADVEAVLRNLSGGNSDSLYHGLRTFLSNRIEQTSQPAMHLIETLYPVSVRRRQRGEAGIAQPMYPG